MKAWMRLTGEDPLQPVTIRPGARALADLDEGFLRLIVIEKNFEADFFRIGDGLLHEAGCFLDVGANYGLLSFGLAARNHHIDFHLFEPNRRLGEVIGRSARDYPKMRLHLNDCALSDRDGEVLMKFDRAHTGASHVSPEGGDTVPCIRLDDYLQRNELERVDFMKLDVEGYERSVLRGAEQALRAQHIRAIYFEYCEKWLRRNHPPRQIDRLPRVIRLRNLLLHGERRPGTRRSLPPPGNPRSRGSARAP